MGSRKGRTPYAKPSHRTEGWRLRIRSWISDQVDSRSAPRELDQGPMRSPLKRRPRSRGLRFRRRKSPPRRSRPRFPLHHDRGSAHGDHLLTEIPPTEIPPTVVATATEIPTVEAPPTQAPTATPPANENPPAEPTATPLTGSLKHLSESPTVEPTPTPQALGSLVVIAEDEHGRRLPGACFTLEIPPGGVTFGPFCDDDGDGAVVLLDVAAGPVAVIESTPPADSAPAVQPRQTVQIAPGEQAEIRFRNLPLAPEPVEEPGGSVDVRIAGPAGEPVAACVDMFSEFEDYIACDNDGQDLDPRSGQVRFDPVTPGSYTVESRSVCRTSWLSPSRSRSRSLPARAPP